ncbi:MAG: zinc ribbon domain-containing protein [Candidatus Kariarchaeaceae archaeon]|jgi:uncharacterized membrane protein
MVMPIIIPQGKKGENYETLPKIAWLIIVILTAIFIAVFFYLGPDNKNLPIIFIIFLVLIILAIFTSIQITKNTEQLSKCPTCGTSNSPNALQCEECGYEINSSKID